MPFFTRQPTGQVEAIQWFPGRRIAAITLENPGHPGGGDLLPSPPYAYLTTRRGRLTVFAGDWVVTEPTGEQHVCPNQLFRQTYAPFDTK